MYISETAGDHLPMLRAIFGLLGGRIRNVIEFGPGVYSTPFFLERGCSVFSVEMQSEEWYNKVSGENPQLTIGFYPGPLTFLENSPDLSWYQFAFIDGHIESRPECINACFDACIPIVATHDYEDPVYGWERVKVPGNYRQFIYCATEKRRSCFWIREDWL